MKGWSARSPEHPHLQGGGWDLPSPDQDLPTVHKTRRDDNDQTRQPSACFPPMYPWLQRQDPGKVLDPRDFFFFFAAFKVQLTSDFRALNTYSQQVSKQRDLQLLDNEVNPTSTYDALIIVIIS